MKRGIFISYRRDPASDLARLIHEKLVQRGYECFLDVVDLNVGDYWERIMTVMDGCDIFMPILTKGALDRCVDPEDSVRREIEAALERDLMVIPVSAGFDWSEKMPEGLEKLADYNAVLYNHTYFEPFINSLCSFIDAARGESHTNREAPKRRVFGGGSGGEGGRKLNLPMVAAGMAVIILIAALCISLWGKGRTADPSGSTPAPQEPASAASEDSAKGERTSAADTESDAPADGQILPDSFLRDIEKLAEKRMSGLLIENAVIEFTAADGSTKDVDSRKISVEGMELKTDALFFETGGTAALYLYYQGTVRIDGDNGGEFPDAVMAFKLDSSPQKFFSASGDGSVNYKESHFGVLGAYISREEYLRNVHKRYQFVDHDFYEIELP